MYEITTEGFAICNNKLYTVGRELSVVFEIDLITGKTSIIKSTFDENLLQERLFNGICVNEDYLALVPFYARKAWIYEFKSKQWYGVDICEHASSQSFRNFVGGCIANNILWMFGYQQKGVVTIDLSTKKVSKLDDNNIANENFWNQTYEISDGKIYLTPAIKDEIICIDIFSKKVERYPLGDLSKGDINSNSGIRKYKDDFYINKHHGNKMYCWNQKSKKIKEIAIDDFYNSPICYFNGIAASENQVFLYSPAGKSYICNLKQREASRIVDETIYYASFIAGLGLMVCKKGSIGILDENLNEIRRFKIALNQEEHKNYFTDCGLKYTVLQENQLVTFEDFMKVVS